VSPRVRTVLVQIGSFVLAGVLLYLALSGVDFAEIGRALRQADYRWLAPLAAVLMLSHWLRAWRWKLLLDALPEAGADERKPLSTGRAFSAVMIGYMTNYAAPRLGEVVRSANLATRERLPFSSVFGTVVVERLLDVIMLLLALGLTALLFLEEAVTFNELFIAPLAEQTGGLSFLALVAVAVGVAVLLVYIFRQKLIRASFVERTWARRVRPVMVSFRDGLRTLVRSPQRAALVGTSIAMWLCYAVAAHLPFVLLRIAEPYDLNLLDSWAIMVIGSLGVVVPSPGGTGSYHYITIQTLVHLFGVGEADAATYAVLVHAAQLLLYVAIGCLCLLLQGASLRNFTSRRTTAEPVPDVNSVTKADRTV
jgi:glycosyltransferase 2 family protein